MGLIILIVAVLEIWSVNRMATYGAEITKLEHSKSVLKLENQLLENEIAQRSSLTNIERYRIYLGFEKVKKIEQVKDFGLALNR